MPLTSELDEKWLVGADDPYDEKNMPFGIVINLDEVNEETLNVNIDTYGLTEIEAIAVLLEAVDILREAISGD